MNLFLLFIYILNVLIIKTEMGKITKIIVLLLLFKVYY